MKQSHFTGQNRQNRIQQLQSVCLLWFVHHEATVYTATCSTCSTHANHVSEPKFSIVKNWSWCEVHGYLKLKKTCLVFFVKPCRGCVVVILQSTSLNLENCGAIAGRKSRMYCVQGDCPSARGLFFFFH